MKASIGSNLINIALCTIFACILTSCYTVKGAFQGAGKDVAVLAGQEQSHHKVSHHKGVAKKPTVSNSSKASTKAQPAQSTTSNPTSGT